MGSYNKEWLSETEIEKLFDHPEIKSRDRLLMRVCYFGLLRIGEALISKNEDYRNEEYPFLLLRVQKTDKKNWEQQTIPLQIYSEVKRFCDDNKIKSQDYVFQSRQSENLSYSRAYQIIKECVEKAGINKPITTHTFRRSRIQHLLNAGENPFYVKELARHKSIDTTRKYLKISKKKLYEIMSKYDETIAKKEAN